MSAFRLLFRIFLNRFFENDAADAAFETNITQILGFLSAAGLFAAVFFMPGFVEMSIHQNVRDVIELAAFRLIFSAYGFAVVGFTAFFQWDMLFPDRRDFLVLTPFPVRLRDLCAARFCALGVFLLLMIGSLDVLPTVMTILISFSSAGFTALAFRIIGSNLLVSICAPAFAFFAVAGLQGVLINITSPRLFRRISPWIQITGMSLMVLSLIAAPIYAVLPTWWRFIPTVWFSGLYQFFLFSPLHPPAWLGPLALKALAVAFVVFVVTWLGGFQRHYRRMLESEDTGSRYGTGGLFDRFITNNQERAIFRFTGKTLARSPKHQFFLAVYWTAGISFGLLAVFDAHQGHLRLSTDGLRSFPFLIGFFIVSGFRATFGFPAELSANWLFQISQGRWSETARDAARKRMLTSGLLPAMLLFVPIEVSEWGMRNGLAHGLMGIAAGAVLNEIFFWSFDKVPFTCSYQGGANLALLAALFFYGISGYSKEMAQLEMYLDSGAMRMMLFFCAAGFALRIFWRRLRAATDVYFKADPSFQTLDLS